MARSGRHTLTAPAPLPKHTARVRRRAEERGGAGPSITRSRGKGRPSPGRGRWSGCRGPGCPVPASGNAVLQERSLPRAQGSRCSLRAGSVPRLRVDPVLSPTLRGRCASASSLEGLYLERWRPPEDCDSPRSRCPGAKRRPWVSLAARKFSKLRADPPTWGESSGWPGAQPRDLFFHTLRASRHFSRGNQASARTTSLSLVLG